MHAKTIKDLFIDELQDMLDAEQRLTKALPKLAKAANSEELSTAFENHLQQTETHVERLKQVLESMDENPKRKTCKAMVGLLEEGQELMHEEGPPSVKDAALIAAAQKVEHYEMATYGCLRTWAQLLGENEAVKILQQTLNEEGEADKLLTRIAMTLNPELDAELEEDEQGDNGKSGRSRSMANAGSRASQSKRNS